MTRARVNVTCCADGLRVVTARGAVEAHEN
jgi:hypothetical protein